mmetsp:Transcript_102822/g.286297  ORF Transcript_102822/g.286297 Transcript_102822/m.286297 type:complete len:200 (-) Transcript_102822:110-709(-)|eukprot:CAMPEP_0179058130 /NCGR_PEP_ID=MMETSP0796-20121207/24692_1 /TAXON_ID=73915 /ORGANISM="Pyrodinium bahamense, Strain pbaha01" /LENGTH=199 /DNA_ID=CAMNT_0020754873 /DNA_START=20 /DNA_END=622 /DNA_ORIENTATION=+
MGAALVRLSRGKRDLKLLMVGLDAAGKTTALYRLKLGELVSTVPTMGINSETVAHRNLSFTIWDIRGQEKIRRLWSQCFLDVQGLIFVVDSNDRKRLMDAREELHRLLSEEQLRGAVLLVFANKQDLPHAMATGEVSEMLGLHTLQSRQWHIQAASATTGTGLCEGLDWLSKALEVSGRHRGWQNPVPVLFGGTVHHYL